MKIAFLIRGEESKRGFEEAALPEGVVRSTGVYEAEGGNLYFVHFVLDGNTIGNARILARLRDDLPNDGNVRILTDEASAKFCELLYPHFCRFEKGLREAITIAICAEQGNYDDKDVSDLEERFTLEALYAVLFFDSGFVKSARKLVKDSNTFTRAQLKDRLDDLEENILWNVLFDENDMPTFRKQHDEIKDRRNDVMHYHTMTEKAFDDTRDLLKAVNIEIDDYIDKVRSDVAYPKARAKNARAAAQIISESYTHMLENLQPAINMSAALNLGEAFNGISRAAANSIDTSSFASVAQQVADSAALLDSVRPASQMVDASAFALSPSVTKAMETIQSALPKYDFAGTAAAAKAASASVRQLQDAISPSVSSSIGRISSLTAGISNETFDSMKRAAAGVSIPTGTLEAIRKAASVSKDFSAGLGLGAALSSLPDTPPSNEEASDNPGDDSSADDSNDREA